MHILLLKENFDTPLPPFLPTFESFQTSLGKSETEFKIHSAYKGAYSVLSTLRFSIFICLESAGDFMALISLNSDK